MPNVRKSLLVLLATAASASSQAVAQAPQQTPENAQRFLAGVWPREYSMTWPGLVSPHPATRTSEVTSADGHCHSSFTTRYPDGSVGSSGMNWRLIAEVRQEVRRVVATRADTPLTVTFDFPAEALAARAAYAMEFLRQHCDPSADTGF